MIATTHVGEALTATYDIYLVILSLIISVIGSGTALELTGLAVASKGARYFWLTGWALAWGITIWAMHFIAMLAYQLPLPVAYNFSIVLLSMAVAIITSGMGLLLVTQQLLNWWLLLSASVFIGLGTIGTHFTAMTGMLLQAMPSYDLKLVLLLEAWAIGLSFSALWLAFHQSANPVNYSIRKIGSVILAGAAIDGMHYIAMAGVSFYSSFKSLPNGIDNYPLAITIGVAILLILLLALITSCFGQRLSAEVAKNLVLQESEQQYQNLYNFAPDAYFSIAPDGRLKSVNQFAAESLGYRKQELIERCFEDLVHETEQEQLQQWMSRFFNSKVVTSEIELRKVRKDGSIIWGCMRGQLFQEGEVAIELQVICRDITQRKRAEEQLRYGAFHDVLTGLANRALFMERLLQSVAQAKRHQDYQFAVLFLDLDRFKVINDSLGHLVGDQLLLALANRLKVCVRPTDTIARLGGDEFTILLEGFQDVSTVLRVVNRIQSELTLPFALNGQEVFTSASIGIALSTTGYDQAEDLLRDADTAMYRAKNQGSAGYALFDLDMHQQAVARWQRETDLRLAVERQEFRLGYQPIVSLQSGGIIGFEALVRWQHPQLGWLLPNEFIPVAEESRFVGLYNARNTNVVDLF